MLLHQFKTDQLELSNSLQRLSKDLVFEEIKVLKSEYIVYLFYNANYSKLCCRLEHIMLFLPIILFHNSYYYTHTTTR